jgi:hypothetical protein
MEALFSTSDHSTKSSGCPPPRAELDVDLHAMNPTITSTMVMNLLMYHLQSHWLVNVEAEAVPFQATFLVDVTFV